MLDRDLLQTDILHCRRDILVTRKLAESSRHGAAKCDKIEAAIFIDGRWQVDICLLRWHLFNRSLEHHCWRLQWRAVSCCRRLRGRCVVCLGQRTKPVDGRTRLLWRGLLSFYVKSSLEWSAVFGRPALIVWRCKLLFEGLLSNLIQLHWCRLHGCLVGACHPPCSPQVYNILEKKPNSRRSLLVFGQFSNLCK